MKKIQQQQQYFYVILMCFLINMCMSWLLLTLILSMHSSTTIAWTRMCSFFLEKLIGTYGIYLVDLELRDIYPFYSHSKTN
jgi:hypothetical protein